MDRWKKWQTKFKSNPAHESMLSELEVLDLGKARRSINAIDVVLKDKKFMKEFGDSNFWTTAERYHRNVKVAQEEYAKIEDSDAKKVFKKRWAHYMRSNIFTGSKQFRTWYDRNIGARDLDNYAWDEA